MKQVPANELVAGHVCAALWYRQVVKQLAEGLLCVMAVDETFVQNLSSGWS